MMSQTFLMAIFILLMLEILVIIRNIKTKEYDIFWWFCEMSPILLIIGLLWGNVQFIKGVISVGLLPQLGSFIILFMVVFFNYKNPNFGGIKEKGSYYIIVSFLLHIVSVNLAFFITLDTKASGISLLYSLLILTFLFITSLLFTDHKKNINFIESLDFVSFKPRFYKYLWIICGFLFLIVPTYFLQNWIFSLLT